VRSRINTGSQHLLTLKTLNRVHAMTTTNPNQTNLEAVNAALPADVKAALITIAGYIDGAEVIGPAASAAALTRSRLAGVIDGLGRTVA
jgi:hypothetical protein